MNVRIRRIININNSIQYLFENTVSLFKKIYNENVKCILSTEIITQIKVYNACSIFFWQRDGSYKQVNIT